MAGEVWFSIVLGAGIGIVYAASSYISVKIALRKSERTFMLLVLGGMAARLFVAVATIAIIIAIVPISKEAFVASFIAVFFIGMFVEVLIIHRLPQRTRASRSEE